MNTMPQNNKCPCKGCLNRQVGCHSVCIDYSKYKCIVAEVNEKRKGEMLIGGFYCDRHKRVENYLRSKRRT